MEKKLDEVIKLLKIQAELINNIFRLLNQSNDDFLIEMNKEDLVREYHGKPTNPLNQ